MIISVRFRVYAFLAVILLVSTLISPGIALSYDSGSDIFENVSCDKKSLRFAEILNDFDTVTANPEVFLKDVADGNVKLKLLGKNFDLELENTHILNDDAKVFIENETGNYTVPATKINTYKGKVVGEKNSSVGLVVSDEALIGQIEVENIYYAIELTNKTIDGKAVLVIYSSEDVKKHENQELDYCETEEHCKVEEQRSLNSIFPILSENCELNYVNDSNSMEYRINTSNSSRKGITAGNISILNDKENVHVIDPENNTINNSVPESPSQGFVLTTSAIAVAAITFCKRKRK